MPTRDLTARRPWLALSPASVSFRCDTSEQKMVRRRDRVERNGIRKSDVVGRFPSVYPPDSVISVKDPVDCGVSEEEEPLIQIVECRIYQEEGSIKNFEVPCVCSGSLEYAHRKYVLQWCNEKDDTTCEICHQVGDLIDRPQVMH